MDFLNSLDSSVFLFFNGLHSPYFDRFMVLATSPWTWLPMFLALFFVLVRSASPKMIMVYIVALFVAISVADHTCAAVIRPAVERMRPANLENDISPLVHIVNGYRGGRYGFPSCHAANTFALLAFIIPVLRNRVVAWTLVGWGGLHVYSRIYLGVHYPGDILCGAVLGTAVGYGCYAVASLCRRRTDKPYLRHASATLFTIATGHRRIAVSAVTVFVAVTISIVAFMCVRAAL